MVKAVIIGGSFAGLDAAKILVQTLGPQLKKAGIPLEVVILSASTHAIFVPAMPRALVEPEVLGKVVFDVAKQAASWGKGKVSVIHGKATAIDTDKKVVSYIQGKSTETSTIPYEALIVASGARSASSVLKLSKPDTNTFEQWKEDFDQISAAIAKSSTIGIAGDGPSGIELAAEIKFKYPKTQVELFVAGDRVLLSLKDQGLSNAAHKKLTELGVKVRTNSKVESVDDSGKTLTLADGSDAKVDLYIPAYGSIPNSDFLPGDLLDENKFLKVNDTLRCIGPKGVYGYGDIVSIAQSNLVALQAQKPVLLSALTKDLLPGTMSHQEKRYPSSSKLTVIIPISRKGGVGKLFGFSMPNFFVGLLKSRSFFIPQAQSYF